MEPINDTQKRIYEFLVERSQDGVPPSVREIGAAVGLKSTSSVQANLDALEKAGYIMRDPMLKRSIRILGQAENITHVPLLGTVTAGLPILAVEQIEGYIPYTGRVSRDKPLFALTVKGESMLWAGILNGDIVIAEKTPYAANGEIVVAETFRKDADEEEDGCFRYDSKLLPLDHMTLTLVLLNMPMRFQCDHDCTGGAGLTAWDEEKTVWAEEDGGENQGTYRPFEGLADLLDNNQEQ